MVGYWGNWACCWSWYVRGIDCRLACLCAYEESSFIFGADACSSGLGLRSAGTVSVEKDFGSKPRGEGDRMKPLAGRDGASWVSCSSPVRPVELYDADSGDIEGSRPRENSLDEAGEALSGFAILRPPSD